MKRTLISLLSILPLTFAACGGSSNHSTDGGSGGGGGTTNSDCTSTGGTNKALYVANTVTVPQSKTDLAIDLNGDGRVDNQLGSIVNILKTENLDVQMGVTQAVVAGTLIVLGTETSQDATFQTDSCASTLIERGAVTTTPPKYDGTDTFTAQTDGDGTFSGPITGGKFNSSSPVTTKNPVSLTIELPLIAGAQPVELDVEGGQLEYKRDTTGAVTGGELHGFLRSTNVQSKVIPNVALLLSSKLMDNPLTATDMQIAMIFDTGGTGTCNGGTTCANPDGSCAVSGDGKIDICEVATNNLIQQVLAPDIQMFDAAGNYSPTAANTTKDSLSLGLGFTFVKASF
ncbi:MAG TPA: hypothetical protein VIA18_13390 [Polyangia bacterium]|jgi:hypothetical protein|nr:hypothetical protein [Polyangia bacterium]